MCEAKRLLEIVKKKIIKNKSFEQIVDECESTEDEIRPLYDSLIAEMGLKNNYGNLEN